MLLPQFTIRNLLFLTAICAVISLVVRQAFAGSAWAIGMSMGIGFIVGTLLIHSILTLLVGLPAYGQSLIRPSVAWPKYTASDSASSTLKPKSGIVVVG